MSDVEVEQQELTFAELGSTRNLCRLDQTLIEVFGLMLGAEIHVNGELGGSDSIAFAAGDQQAAIVRFAGAMRGTCEVRMNVAAALAITTTMIGEAIPIEEANGSMRDAVGEICNMIAAGWKNSVPSLGSRCSLSPPTVIAGSNYLVHPSSFGMGITRRYQFAAHHLEPQNIDGSSGQCRVSSRDSLRRFGSQLGRPVPCARNKVFSIVSIVSCNFSIVGSNSI